MKPLTWSVGLTGVELALGVKLYKHKSRMVNSMLKCVVQILGKPLDHVLEKGIKAPYIINWDNHWCPKMDREARRAVRV